jgi:hypothetical protein
MRFEYSRLSAWEALRVVLEAREGIKPQFRNLAFVSYPTSDLD